MDSIYLDTPAINDSSKISQISVGMKLLIMNIYGIKTKKVL